jgi:hypothetical protein
MSNLTDTPRPSAKPAKVRSLTPKPAPAKARKLATSGRDRFKRR